MPPTAPDHCAVASTSASCGSPVAAGTNFATGHKYAASSATDSPAHRFSALEGSSSPARSPSRLPNPPARERRTPRSSTRSWIAWLRSNPALLQPIGHSSQLRCRAAEALHRLAVPVRWNRYVMGFVTMSMPAASGCTSCKARSALWIFRSRSRRCLRFIWRQLSCLDWLVDFSVGSFAWLSWKPLVFNFDVARPVDETSQSLHRGQAILLFRTMPATTHTIATTGAML